MTRGDDAFGYETAPWLDPYDTWDDDFDGYDDYDDREEPVLDEDESIEVTTRQEQREARIANGRKMRVSGRSTFLLRNLSLGPDTRRRQRRRK